MPLRIELVGIYLEKPPKLKSEFYFYRRIYKIAKNGKFRFFRGPIEKRTEYTGSEWGRRRFPWRKYEHHQRAMARIFNFQAYICGS